MPPRRSSPEIIQRARELRKNPEPAEVKLWIFLRSLRAKGFHFRRQHALGPYITDFCSPGLRLVIEVDGDQHLDQKDYDLERTAFLAEKGFTVLRFWNKEVMNRMDEVMKIILDVIGNIGNG